ncbi:MAG: response regulator transcription factor [Clostridia bacterium]|nr:response regulator transcription factor [Clostridia bacterium]
MQKILVVEDDKKLRKELEKFLNNNGYKAEGLEKYDNCIEDILQSKSDLILLDINLPFSDGEYICKEIRKVSEVPIIMITSRDNEMDELISINYGADDYITKPYNTQILLARIASILKRANKNELEKSKIDCIEFILNISESKIEKGNIEIELTKNESKILQCLVKNRNKIVSREELMDYLWNTDEFVDDNTLTVNITRVRNKLEEIGLKEIIETKRGQGYILK